MKMSGRGLLKRLLLVLLLDQAVGWLLAWSDTIGGAFSPGPYALVGVSLAILFVLLRLVLWLLILPALVATAAAAAAGYASHRGVRGSGGER